MKKMIYIASTLVLVGLFSSCKSGKKTTYQKSTDAVEITVPFSTKEYRTDEDNYRAKASGKSPDMETSKKIATQNARAQLAANIQATVKRVTDQYTNQRTVGNKQDFENKFEELSREVVNQTLTDVNVIGDKIFKESDGAFTSWIAVEANKKTVLAGIDKKISNSAALKLDYDKKKFEEIYNQEMQKLADDQK